MVRKAAEQGHASAQVNLGVMYGEGPTPVYRKAAEQGAASDLGVMYDKGEGVPEDDRSSVKWYRRAGVDC